MCVISEVWPHEQRQVSPASLRLTSSSDKPLVGDTAIAEFLDGHRRASVRGSASNKAAIHDVLIASKDLCPRTPETWASMNASLSNKTFVAGHSMSLADLAAYSSLYIPFVRCINESFFCFIILTVH